jgi:catechol 2,3-dioxygenase-like lactoylglutathione lyase family enzyme
MPLGTYHKAEEINMSGPQMVKKQESQIPGAGTVDMKLEVVVLPVADVERAKRFYEGLGWRLDGDFVVGDSFHAVQMTPPGSPCSIHFGKGITPAAPGSAQGMYLVVDDIEAARAELIAKGVDVSEPIHFDAVGGPPMPGVHPEHRSYSTYASFSDPDGNGWQIQEVTSRLPGRGLSLDITTMTELLRETEEGHGKYEPTAPKHHWSEWYGAYMVARERGRTPEDAAKDAALHMERGRG